MAVTTTKCGDSPACVPRRQNCASIALGSTPTLASGIHRAACAATTLLTPLNTIRSRDHRNSDSLAPRSMALRWSMEWKVTIVGSACRAPASAPP
jgi:hypothetical protein